MLTEERYSKIMAKIEKDGSASVQDLISELDASESTVRRDLNAMDAKGLLVKVHGGAIAKNVGVASQDIRISSRKELHAEEKAEIARYAASLIEPGDFIYLDAGTTTGKMIDYLGRADSSTGKEVTFVTNSIGHALGLAELGYTVYMLGGICKSVTEAIVGAEAVANLDKYNFTKGFWGTNGIHPIFGQTTPDVREAMVKGRGMEHCAKRYVLADASKFQVVSNVKFAEFTDAEILTTGEAPEEFRVYEHVIVVR